MPSNANGGHAVVDVEPLNAKVPTAALDVPVHVLCSTAVPLASCTNNVTNVTGPGDQLDALMDHDTLPLSVTMRDDDSGTDAPSPAWQTK